MKIQISGHDPSMSNWGIANGTIDTRTLEVEITEFFITKTKSEKGKVVRANSDDLRRASELREGAMKAIEDAQMVFVEVPHGSQSARAMASYGVCVGVLSAIDKPLIQVTAGEVKKIVGKKDPLQKGAATKREMIDWAMKMQPNAPWKMKKIKGELSSVDGVNEHLADAIIAIYAGIKTEQFKNILNVVTKLSVAA